jgi:hypothetical protein
MLKPHCIRCCHFKVDDVHSKLSQSHQYALLKTTSQRHCISNVRQTLVTAWMPWQPNVNLLVPAGTSTHLNWIQCGFSILLNIFNFHKNWKCNTHAGIWVTFWFLWQQNSVSGIKMFKSLQLFKDWDFFEKNSENAYFPKNGWLIWTTNGTIGKCSSRAFQWMVMSVGSDNLKFGGNFCVLTWWQKSLPVLKGLL